MPFMRSSSAVSRVARLLAGLSLVLLAASDAAAQRKYRIEISVAPLYQTFDASTDLGGALGGTGRLGVWLPWHLSVEGEGTVVKPTTNSAGIGVTVKTFDAALLYNVPIGRASFAYLKAGFGTTTYGGNCPAASIPGSGPCGSTGALIGGLGVRYGLTETILARAEGTINRSTKLSFSNYGVSLGVSLMLGSTRIVDTDQDGVIDSRDRCPNTPIGALVDSHGCPTDTDHDKVFDGLDRCPDTPPGAAVDASGCPADSDKDGVPDGVDKCPNTPAGAIVDAAGCPRDSDHDGVPDGLDRCPDTPPGAAVDQLGCPGDSDGDGVLDGLDRCPNTPPGARVNAFGCPIGQTGVPPKPAAEPGKAAVPAVPAPSGAAVSAPTSIVVLRGVTFVPGSARLTPASLPVLDSIAQVLLANPTARFEVAGHTDASGAAAENLHLSTLRAEAVRRFLISAGVPFQWLTSKGYGATQPLTTDKSPAGRAANRRVELRPAPNGP